MLKIVWNFWLAALPYVAGLVATVGGPYVDLPIDVPAALAYTAWATQLLVGTTQDVLTFIYHLRFDATAGELLGSGTTLVLVSFVLFWVCGLATQALRAQTRFQARRYKNGRDLWRERKNLSAKTT